MWSRAAASGLLFAYLRGSGAFKLGGPVVHQCLPSNHTDYDCMLPVPDGAMADEYVFWWSYTDDGWLHARVVSVRARKGDSGYLAWGTSLDGRMTDGTAVIGALNSGSGSGSGSVALHSLSGYSPSDVTPIPTDDRTLHSGSIARFGESGALEFKFKLKLAEEWRLRPGGARAHGHCLWAYGFAAGEYHAAAGSFQVDFSTRGGADAGAQQVEL
eukprot:TRINITY_DN5331_c2_g1_i1.p1 TRINITY_DN5331_c2_g1~~TRINITY_DN5331_c2_g1_i1.p1  ORF type:complete len:214 (+),score=47.02 TRINITY_DN5331_c2_g1_i1:150-791(+)